MEDRPELVFVNEDADPSGPGVHAFVMGVSRYRDRRPGKLTDIPGTAVGAARFAEFLRHGFHDPSGIPLKNIRMLLSPVAEERDQLPPLGVSAPEATRGDVEAALLAWQLDCDRHSENIGVLYLGGHGVSAGPDTQYVFLSEANDKPEDQFHFSVDVPVCVEVVRRSRLRSLIVVSDCCALTDFGPIGDALPIRLRVGALGRNLLDPVLPACDYLLKINAARAGTAGYALGAKGGTLLAANLLLVLSGKAGGKIVGWHPREKDFRVTNDFLDERLKKVVLEYLNCLPRRERQKLPIEGGPFPTVHGNYVSSGINRPQPPPEFDVEFSPRPPREKISMEVRAQKSGARVWGIETISGPTPVPLPAGCYEVQSGSPMNFAQELEVYGPREFDVGRYL